MGADHRPPPRHRSGPLHSSNLRPRTAERRGRSVTEALDQTLDREELHHCLDRLSSLQLQAIVLAFYDGHTYPEIATLLGVPLGRVKARIRDAVSTLRDCMQAGQ